MIAAIILAAGASSRMGRPKALLTAPGGKTFLETLTATLGRHCAPVVVVLGHEAAAVQAGTRCGADAGLVTNPEPERGMLSSLQCGIRALPAGFEAVVFTPVDNPSVRADTVAALLDAFSRTRARAIVPRYRGRNGHPVCCSAEAAAALSALPAGARARDVIHDDRTLYLETDDPGVVQDIDDPEAYKKLSDSPVGA